MSIRSRPQLARRISVVGSSGSGKTYLARSLADRLRLPVHELDVFRWDPTGRELPYREFVDLVETLAAQGEWIIDGHYRDVRHLIWQRAEMVVWLNYPLPVVALRLLGRFRQKQRAPGAGRPASVLGAVDALSAAPPVGAAWRRRLSRLVRNLRERSEYRRLLHAPEYGALSVIELKSIRATRRWLEGLAPASEPAPEPRATAYKPGAVGE